MPDHVDARRRDREDVRQVTTMQPTLLLDGQRFPEGLRWHDDHLWFSDVAARRVVRVTMDGSADAVAVFDEDEPSGLGFLPDGTALVVMMWSRRIVAIAPGGPAETYADLGHVGVGWLNDMVVDGRGNAYVGNAYPLAEISSPFRTDTRPRDPRGESIVLVTRDGAARVAAWGLAGPNGMVVTADGATLIVAESPLHKLAAFDIDGDGSLSGRRTFAELGDVRPDGLAIDIEGGVWVGTHSLGDGVGGGCVRFTEGGTRTDVVLSGAGGGVACALGGSDRTTLFFSSIVAGSVAALREEGGCLGRIETTTVTIPGAGWP